MARAREEGGEAALARKRGRPPLDPGFKTQRYENGRRQRENAALKERLRRQGITVDAPQKLAELLAPLADPRSGSAG